MVCAAKKATKSGSAISGDLLSKLANYVSKGYVSKSFYQACLNYNSALDSKNQAIAQKEIDMQTAIQEKNANQKQKYQSVKERYDEIAQHFVTQ